MSLPPNGPFPPNQGAGPPFGPPPQFGGPPAPRPRRTGLIVGSIVAVIAVVTGIVAAVVLTRGGDEDEPKASATSATSTTARVSDTAPAEETSIGPTRLERTRTTSSRSGTSTSSSSSSRSSTTTARPAPPSADEAEIAHVTEIVAESSTEDALSYYCSTFAPAPNSEDVVYTYVGIDNVQVSGSTATADVTLVDQGEEIEFRLDYVKESDGWKYCPS